MLPPPHGLYPEPAAPEGSVPGYLYESSDMIPMLAARKQDSEQYNTHIKVQMPGAPSSTIHIHPSQGGRNNNTDADSNHLKNLSLGTMSDDQEEAAIVDTVISIGQGGDYTDAGSS